MRSVARPVEVVEIERGVEANDRGVWGIQVSKELVDTRSDALVLPPLHQRDELHQPIVQALAVIKGSPHEREARLFADFITGPEGQEVLRKYDFGPPDAEAAR